MTHPLHTTVSLVSHGQIELARQALTDLAECPEVVQIVLTINIPEPVPQDLPGLDTGKLTIVYNPLPKGFGQNHNAAFTHCRTPLFCILNPDVRLRPDTFASLTRQLAASPSIGLISPVVLNAQGQVEDSARDFPTPLGLALRVLGFSSGAHEGDDDQDLRPEWVAGMFMLLSHDTFATIGGFDEGFFMYCEDIDLCLRLRHKRLDIVRSAQARIIHDARRGSRHDIRYMVWHIGSLLRLWRKHAVRAMGLARSH